MDYLTFGLTVQDELSSCDDRKSSNNVSLNITTHCQEISQLNQSRLIPPPLDKDELADFDDNIERISSRTSPRKNNGDETYLKTIGTKIFNALFRNPWDVYLDKVGEYLSHPDCSKQGLKICVYAQGEISERTPWELLCNSSSNGYYFLGCKESSTIVRVSTRRLRCEQQLMSKPISVLLAGASPINRGGDVYATSEIETINGYLKPLKKTHQVKVTTMRKSSWRNFRRLVSKSKPQVLHLVAHGCDETILFETSEKQDIPVKFDALCNFLSHAEDLRLVVLSICSSERMLRNQGSSLIHHIPSSKGIWAILLMRTTISSDASYEFSRALYESLADGKSMAQAMAAARNSVYGMQPPKGLEWSTPILHQACDVVPFPPLRDIMDIANGRSLDIEIINSLKRKREQLGILVDYIREVTEDLENPCGLTLSALNSFIQKPISEDKRLILETLNELSNVRECPTSQLRQLEITIRSARQFEADFESMSLVLSDFQNIDDARQVSQIAYGSIEKLIRSITRLLSNGHI